MIKGIKSRYNVREYERMRCRKARWNSLGRRGLRVWGLPELNVGGEPGWGRILLSAYGVEMSVVSKKAGDGKCAICGEFHPFEMPDAILEELCKKQLAIFAGAGVSTENRVVYPYTLYDDVKGELGMSPDNRIGFSEVMSLYCAQPNGRTKLLQKIQERMRYIRSFPEVYRAATRFHREMSTIHQLETIITTNWDDYFESECGATPFVTPQDFAFWNIPGRKVFKIHGSINNYGSIVATSEDYRKCYRRLRDGILGSTLKHLVGTKTIVYVGYSFGDEDFTKIYGLLKREMGSLLPHGYIVTLDRAYDDRFKKIGLSPIYTEAAHFVSTIKKHLVANGQMMDDERFEDIAWELEKVIFEHYRLAAAYDCRKCQDIIYALSYQDGLIHAFERVLELKKTGAYSHRCEIENVIKDYSRVRREKLKKKRYCDVAYIDGYQVGLVFLLFDEDMRKAWRYPRYYVFGLRMQDQPRTFSQYKKIRRKAAEMHKSAQRYAERTVREQIKENPELVFHHTCFLL